MTVKQWGAAGVEMKVPSAENLEPTNGLLLKPGVGRSTALHAFPPEHFLVLISVFMTGSPSFSANFLPTF